LSEKGAISALPRQSDEQLLQGIARGEEPALTELHLRHGQAIFFYLLRMVRDRESAEEILQDTFIAVWRSAPSF
jgi:RNA polymerase sigma-70 factor (ECF subfamily)